MLNYIKSLDDAEKRINKKVGVFVDRKNKSNNELWEIGYSYAYKYYNVHRSLIMPAKHIEDGYRLGAWICTQRTAFKNGKISREHIERLNKIDMVWDLYEYQWMEMYKEACKYYEVFGDLAIPLRYITKEGKKLGSWISEQRKDYRAIKQNKKQNSFFTQEKIELLNRIEMIWDNSKSVNATSFSEQCVLYYLKKTGLNVLSRAKIDGVELDIFIPEKKIAIEYDGEAWHKSVDRDIKKNNACVEAGILLLRIREPKCLCLQSSSIDYYLKDYSYENLAECISDIITSQFDISLDVDINRDFREIAEQYVLYSKQAWKNYYELAKQFYRENGHLQVPRNYVENDVFLGSWIHDLRKGSSSGRIPLSEKQINQLNEIGMIWNVYDSTWEQMYKAAQTYHKEHGTLQVSKKFKNNDENNLYYWINDQRKKYVKGLLESEKIQMLESIGIVWKPISDKWDFMYSLAKRYYDQHGDLLISTDTIIDNQNIGNWISVQRKKYNKPNSKTGVLSDTQVAKLNAIHMVWDVAEDEWLQMYREIEKYYAEHGNIRINRNYCVNGKKLGVWIGQQRVRYNRQDGSISSERIEYLNQLGMIWDEMLEKWHDYYEIAVQCFKENGTINVAQQYRYKGKALGKWLYRQKVQMKNNSLSDYQIALLKKLDFDI